MAQPARAECRRESMKSLLIIFLLVACSAPSVRRPSSVDQAEINRGLQLAAKYGLTLFHWNVQYVLGSPKTEDQLVIQSFEPIVDVYVAHPGWKVTFEMQGYMIEVIAERHPGVLKKLQALQANNQLEIISCHYSDQLVLAYPREDLEKSLALNDAVYAKYGLKVSSVIYLQEGQTGEGVMKVLGQHGRRIAVVTNGWDEFRSNPPSAYYDQNGTTVLMAGLGANWLYLGDAELAAVNPGTNPYTYYAGHLLGLDWWHKEKPEILKNALSGVAGMMRAHKGLATIQKWLDTVSDVTVYRKNPKTVQEYSDRIAAFEAAGGHTAFIADYVADLEKAGIPKPPTGPLLDKMRGNFTNNVWLWMGDNRDQFAEDDEQVVSGNYRSRSWLAAAEKAVAWARTHNVALDAGLEARIADAWRTQLLGECSDSTGLGFPLAIEVNFGINSAKAVEKTSKEILDQVKSAIHAQKIRVDTRTGEVETSWQQADAGTSVSDGPVPLLREGGMIVERTAWRKVSENRYELSLFWTPVLPEKVSFMLDHVKIGFISSDPNVTYSPALLDDEFRSYPLSDFAFESIYQPLANGLIGLGNGWYVIKHTAVNHVAARIDKTGHRITFEVRNPGMRLHNWRFTLVHGTPEEAVRAADEINVHPKIVY
jgi:hypothetical protein